MMPDLYSLGKLVLLLGIILVIFGGLLMFGGHLGPLGKLPGDIFVERGNVKFYFPVVTMLLLSLILSVLLNLFLRR